MVSFTSFFDREEQMPKHKNNRWSPVIGFIMFARFGTLLLIVISVILLFSATADAAINVDYVSPDSSYDNYLFIHKVPFGHDVTMWIRGDDLHVHGDHKQICKYEDNEHLKPVGEVFLKQFPTQWVARQWAYIGSPVATYDPCKNPYPVKFKNDWNFDF